MTRNIPNKPSNKDLIKFLVPKPLKNSLLIIALERNISISALLRIISSEYAKRNQDK